MGIRARVEDAEILWQSGRREGAWTMALIAAAATSRKRYPRPEKDNVAFKSFIRDVMPTLIAGKPASAPNPAILFDTTPVEEIVYKHLRCNLVHEGELDPQVALSSSQLIDGELKAKLAVGTPNVLPDFFALHLLKAVREAPENATEFK